MDANTELIPNTGINTNSNQNSRKITIDKMIFNSIK